MRHPVGHNQATAHVPRARRIQFSKILHFTQHHVKRAIIVTRLPSVPPFPYAYEGSQARLAALILLDELQGELGAMKKTHGIILVRKKEDNRSRSRTYQ